MAGWPVSGITTALTCVHCESERRRVVHDRGPARRGKDFVARSIGRLGKGLLTMAERSTLIEKIDRGGMGVVWKAAPQSS